MEPLDLLRAVGISLAVLGIYVLAVIIHELGHLIACLACGFEVDSIRVSSLKLTMSEPRRFTWHWKWSDLSSGAVGFCASGRSTSHTGIRYVLVVISGVAANAASVPLVASWADLRGVRAEFAGCFIALTLLVAFTNLMPFRYRDVTLDGFLLVVFLFAGKAKRNELIARLKLSPLLRDFHKAHNAGDKQRALHWLTQVINVCRLLPEFRTKPKLIPLLAKLENLQSNLELAIVTETPIAADLPTL